MISSSPPSSLFSSSSLQSQGRQKGIDDAPLARGALQRALEEARPQIRVDRRNAWRFALIASVSLVLFYAWMCLFHPFGERVNKDCSNVFTTLMSLLGMSGCFICASTRRDAPALVRAGWTVLGLGWTFSTLGESVWVVRETLLRQEVPFPSMADVCFVFCYIALLSGMVLIFRGGCFANRPRIALDSALLAGTFGALAWFFVLQPVWTAHKAVGSFSLLIELAYPLFDVLILWAALTLVYIPVRYGSASRANNFVASSTALLACVGLWYAFLNVSGSFSSGGLNDLASGTAYALVGLSMLAIAWDREPWQIGQVSPEVEEDEANSLMRVLLPYFFTLCVFTLIACHQLRTTKTLGLDVLGWCLVFLGIIMARQMVSLSENVRLARQMRSLNKGLDGQVQSRTRQLDAMLQLTKAVNASLVEEEVVQQAVLSARLAVPMNASAVWNWGGAEERARLVFTQEHDESSENSFCIVPNLFADEHLGQLARQVALTGHALDCCEDDLKTVPTKRNEDEECSFCLHLEPISFNGHVLGVLGALRDSSASNKAAFTLDESRLLENIGLEVGAALQNARTYTQAVDAADHDAATGLLNHRAMQSRFEMAWEQAQTQKKPLSVVMMDLNNFKNFNDTYGHLVGDDVLRLVAHTLKQVCRDKDFVARYGGDEFFMLLPDTDTEGALCVARRLQESMAQVEFRPNGSRDTLPLSLSFGVATAPTDARSKLELVAVADKNLYSAKGSRDAIRSTSKVLQNRLLLLGDEGVAALDAMVTAVSNADDYTRQHSEDVTRYALWIADELGLDEETKRTIEIGGLLHDVGKICVPQEVLKKPGRLSDAEFAAMKTHPAMGALLVGAVLPDAGVLQVVRSHHERFDGRGYPDALAGEDIPLLGRLVAVADAFSAMTTSRPYRKGLSLEQAREEIERGIGTQFDPQMGHAFIRALDKQSAF